MEPPPPAKRAKLEDTTTSAATVAGSGNFRAVADLFAGAKNIMVLVGAGISVSAGIPDFRSPGGLFSMIEEARDQEQPKPALIALIQRATAPPPPTASYSHHELRLELIATARQMNTTGINQGTSGNISIRVSDGVSEGFLITPSGLPYDTMVPEQLVYMDLDSAGYYGEHLPSSEWRMVRAPGPGQAPAPRWHCLRFLWLDTHVPPPEQHLDIYRARPAAKAILHAHPTYCTALAALHLEIPAFHYMVGAAGGKKIPCAKPATARENCATVCC